MFVFFPRRWTDRYLTDDWMEGNPRLNKNMVPNKRTFFWNPFFLHFLTDRNGGSSLSSVFKGWMKVACYNFSSCLLFQHPTSTEKGWKLLRNVGSIVQIKPFLFTLLMRVLINCLLLGIIFLFILALTDCLPFQPQFYIPLFSLST